jgi:hypothetical protein
MFLPSGRIRAFMVRACRISRILAGNRPAFHLSGRAERAEGGASVGDAKGRRLRRNYQLPTPGRIARLICSQRDESTAPLWPVASRGGASAGNPTGGEGFGASLGAWFRSGDQSATVSSSRKIHFSTSNFWRLRASAYSGFLTRLPGPFITIWIFSLGMWCFSRTKEAS